MGPQRSAIHGFTADKRLIARHDGRFVDCADTIAPKPHSLRDLVD
jgi:hypothetical protein